MKFEEAISHLRNGEKIRRQKWNECNYWFINSQKLVVNQSNQNVMVFLTPVIYANDWEVYDDTILTEEEAKYLKFIIEPFKAEVGYISKKRNSSDKSLAHICIFGKGNSIIATLPWLKITEKYVNMAVDKNYTLKELKLYE